jgi:hypothetical protein
MVAIGLQCSCKIQYSNRWNKQALQQARHNSALLTKLEQLQRVYDILLGARNTITQEITLTVAGKQLFHKYKQYHLSYRVCQEGYMAYHGISTYQFYTVLRHVNEGSVPYTVHGNQLCDHSSIKKVLCSTRRYHT